MTVVVSSLIALMTDQCDALAAKGIAATRLDSSLSAAEFLAVNVAPSAGVACGGTKKKGGTGPEGSMGGVKALALPRLSPGTALTPPGT